MSVEETENLPVCDIHTLADWLAGRLDVLINEAKEQHRQGLTRPL